MRRMCICLEMHEKGFSKSQSVAVCVGGGGGGVGGRGHLASAGTTWASGTQHALHGWTTVAQESLSVPACSRTQRGRLLLLSVSLLPVRPLWLLRLSCEVQCSRQPRGRSANQQLEQRPARLSSHCVGTSNADYSSNFKPLQTPPKHLPAHLLSPHAWGGAGPGPCTRHPPAPPAPP